MPDALIVVHDTVIKATWQRAHKSIIFLICYAQYQPTVDVWLQAEQKSRCDCCNYRYTSKWCHWLENCANDE